jgi:hypothetical protein
MRRALFASAVALLLTPASALAAAPTASTGSAGQITTTGARLAGSVNPHGTATTWYFQYGLNTGYGSRTAGQSAGSGSSATPVSVHVGGLQPGTTYHFRLVAKSSGGTAFGADHAFTTARVPLHITIAPNPKLVTFGFGTILGGRLTGTGAGGHQVVLQQRAWPFRKGFANVASVNTDANGFFHFPPVVPQLSMQYRVRAEGKPGAQSFNANVKVRALVHTRISARTVRRGRSVVFSGTVAPARTHQRFGIQRRRSGKWVTLSGGLVVNGAYSRRVKITRTSFYRVFIQAGDGAVLSNAGVTKHIRVTRR